MESVLEEVKDNPKARIPTLYWFGTAYMRLAERKNCVNGHTEDACIFPLQKTGIHKDKSPARKAIETFQAFLTESPDDPNYFDGVWLLNIAYMAVGEYPREVPKKWLLADLKKSEFVVKPFADVSGCLKISVNNRSGGSIVEDFNNDGHLDLIISGWDVGEDVMYYFLNNGDGTFTDRSQASGLNQFKGGLNIQQTDFNNDGNLGIWVLRGAWQGTNGPYGEQPNSLLRNNGDGTFTDVTIAAGLWSLCPTQASAWNDFNHDGWSDLFLSSMDGKKVLLHNTAQTVKTPKFEDVSAKAGFATELYPSFPTFFFDYDNDGWLDIFVCNYDFNKAHSHYFAREALGLPSDGSGMPVLYHNNGDGTFTNTTKAMNLNKTAFAMSANFGAKLTLKFTENGVARTVYRELNSGGSFGSSPLRREIGIGAATTVDEIRITWPATGLTQVLTNVEPNQYLLIKEGTEGSSKLPLQKLPFASEATGIPMCAPSI
ncbi:MAG: CRTAC1 family protein [Saprospiraceae bacterium]|nr:CRTAC1 family protein [Saprospiraceae bacterium]